MTCKHAKFMQWFENPIVAECNYNNERYVAEARRICKIYEYVNNPNPTIQHFDSYASH